jgi:hypothetical protein
MIEIAAVAAGALMLTSAQAAEISVAGPDQNGSSSTPADMDGFGPRCAGCGGALSRAIGKRATMMDVLCPWIDLLVR